jgi:hypothetical protein
MTTIIRINYIFWKQGPLLFDCHFDKLSATAQSRLPRLLTSKWDPT